MSGETMVAAGDAASNPYFDVEATRNAIAADALACVQGRFPDGRLPEEGFTVLFPAGDERRPIAGAGEDIPLAVAAGLMFGPAKRPGYRGRDEAVPDSERFIGVAKVVFALGGGKSLPGAIPVGMGEGSVKDGVPVSSFYLRGFASGSADVAMQDAAERAFVVSMEDVVSCVASDHDYEAADLYAALEALGAQASSLRTAAIE